jgi:hypothetical protein
VKTLPRRLLRDSLTIEKYLGAGGVGAVIDDPVTVLGKVAMIRQLVRNVQGVEVVSEMTVYLHPDDAAPAVPESRVTFDGRVSTVITSGQQARPGEPVLVKVTCT